MRLARLCQGGVKSRNGGHRILRKGYYTIRTASVLIDMNEDVTEEAYRRTNQERELRLLFISGFDLRDPIFLEVSKSDNVVHIVDDPESS